MRILIMNANADAERAGCERYLSSLEEALRAAGHDVRTLILRDMDLKRCTGCFGCWVKTPGDCVVRDEHESLCRAMLGIDLIIHYTPLEMGFVSPLMRRANEKMIPILLPYFTVRGGAIHHSLRYEAPYADLALIYEPEADTDAQDEAIIRDIYLELADETGSALRFMLPNTVSPLEVTHAIAGV